MSITWTDAILLATLLESLMSLAHSYHGNRISVVLQNVIHRNKLGRSFLGQQTTKLLTIPWDSLEVMAER